MIDWTSGIDDRMYDHSYEGELRQMRMIAQRQMLLLTNIALLGVNIKNQALLNDNRSGISKVLDTNEIKLQDAPSLRELRFLKEMSRSGIIQVLYINDKGNISDLLTKRTSYVNQKYQDFFRMQDEGTIVLRYQDAIGRRNLTKPS